MCGSDSGLSTQRDIEELACFTNTISFLWQGCFLTHSHKTQYDYIPVLGTHICTLTKTDVFQHLPNILTLNKLQDQVCYALILLQFNASFFSVKDSDPPICSHLKHPVAKWGDSQTDTCTGPITLCVFITSVYPVTTSDPRQTYTHFEDWVVYSETSGQRKN